MYMIIVASSYTSAQKPRLMMHTAETRIALLRQVKGYYKAHYAYGGFDPATNTISNKLSSTKIERIGAP